MKMNSHQPLNQAKLFLSNVSEYQMPYREDENIVSFWMGRPDQSTPSSKKKAPLEIVTNWEAQEERNKFQHTVYKTNLNFDILSKLVLECYLPKVKVKDEFIHEVRISWPKYAVFKFIERLEWVIDKQKPITTLSPITLLFASQFGIKDKRREAFEFRVGNRDELLEWNTELPQGKVKFLIPFGFTRDPRVSIPLFLHEDSPVTFSGKYKININTVLQMQKFENGEWTDIEFDENYLEAGSTFTTPKLLGTYHMLLKSKRDEILKNILNGEKHYIEYDDFLEASSSENTFSQSIDIPLADESPTRTIFFCVQNEEEEYVNHVNFLNKKGEKPMKKAEIFLGKDPEPYDVIDDFDFIEAMSNQSRSKPTLQGIYFYHFGSDDEKLFALNNPNSVQLKGLDCHLKIIVSEEDRKRRQREKRDDEELFKAYVYLNVLKRITYYIDEDKKLKIDLFDESGFFMRELSNKLDMLN